MFPLLWFEIKFVVFLSMGFDDVYHLAGMCAPCAYALLVQLVFLFLSPWTQTLLFVFLHFSKPTLLTLFPFCVLVSDQRMCAVKGSPPAPVLTQRPGLPACLLSRPARLEVIQNFEW